MLLSSFTPAFLLAVRTAFAANPVNPSDASADSPNLKLKVSTSFPQAEIFGVKLINGQATESVVSIDNNELEPITVHVIGGSLWSGSDYKQLVSNLTSTQFNTKIPAGESQTFNYKFTVDLHPQDFNLRLVALISDHKGSVHQLLAYNEVVGVAEAPNSIFDPQIVFLYLILAGAFAGTAYFVYTTWITTLFPQMATKKRSGGKDGSRAKASSRGSKKVDGATQQVSVVGADGPAVTSSSKAYDESWIPADLISRPQGKRTPSSARKTKIVA